MRSNRGNQAPNRVDIIKKELTLEQKRKSNLPLAQQPEITSEQLAAQVSAFDELRSWSRPETDEEIEKRVSEYFQFCIRRQIRPGVEGLCLALGRTRQGLIVMQNSGGRRGAAIDRAKGLLAALLEEWSLSGKINPVTFIFLAKNHYGYRDKSELEVATRPDIMPTKTLEEIMRDIPIDDSDDDIPDDFTDDIPEY